MDWPKAEGHHLPHRTMPLPRTGREPSPSAGPQLPPGLQVALGVSVKPVTIHQVETRLAREGRGSDHWPWPWLAGSSRPQGGRRSLCAPDSLNKQRSDTQQMESGGLELTSNETIAHAPAGFDTCFQRPGPGPRHLSLLPQPPTPFPLEEPRRTGGGQGSPFCALQVQGMPTAPFPSRLSHTPCSNSHKGVGDEHAESSR